MRDGEKKRERKNLADEWEKQKVVLDIPRTYYPDSSDVRVVGEIWRRKKEIHCKDEARNEMEREKEKEKAKRQTPPEARDANYSGSYEQFVDYPGNVCLIPAGSREPGGIYICGEYRGYNARYVENYRRDYTVCVSCASESQGPPRWRNRGISVRACKGSNLKTMYTRASSFNRNRYDFPSWVSSPDRLLSRARTRNVFFLRPAEIMNQVFRWGFSTLYPEY